MKHLSLTVFGKVQGVFYRATAQEKARQLQISCSATNHPDGSVHIEAEGEAEALQTFLDWNRHGPDTARVEKVEYTITDLNPNNS